MACRIVVEYEELSGILVESQERRTTGKVKGNDLATEVFVRWEYRF
jgi:hypothetical protein